MKMYDLRLYNAKAVETESVIEATKIEELMGRYRVDSSASGFWEPLEAG